MRAGGAAAAVLSFAAASEAAAPIEIAAEADGHTIRIVMNDSPEAEQFLKMLPVSVRMGKFGGREFFGPLEGEISAQGDGQYTFKDGTLTYCPTNNTVAIFYAQSSRPNLTMAVYPMGQVVSDLGVFSEMSRSAVFTFSLPKVQP